MVFVNEIIPRLDLPPRGETALHAACRGGHWEIVQVLLEAGANLDPMDANGDTPLIMAALRGYLKVCQVLLDAGANLNAVSVLSGYTALHAASCYGHLDVVQELCERAAASGNNNNNKLMTRKNRYNRTPLDLAYWCRKDNVVDHLLQKYSQTVFEAHGKMSLHCLMQKASFTDNSDDVVLPIGTLKTDHTQTLLKYLVARDAGMVKEKDKNGLLPLHKACKTGAPFHVFNFLLRRYPEALLSLYEVQKRVDSE